MFKRLDEKHVTTLLIAMGVILFFGGTLVGALLATAMPMVKIISVGIIALVLLLIMAFLWGTTNKPPKK